MIKYINIFISLIILFFASCQNDNSNFNNQNNTSFKTVKLATNQDSIDYALGVVIGNQMLKYGINEVDYSILKRAITDVIENRNQNLPIEKEDAKKIISLYVNETQSKKIDEFIDKNTAFLNENAKKKDVNILTKGIQYKILSKGKGKSPKLTSRVTVDYIGKLVDGTTFVSTKSANPVTFVVKNSLPGWQKALLKMSVGSEWIIYIHPNYAYGSRGNKKVPPNAIVIYKIKLLKIL